MGLLKRFFGEHGARNVITLFHSPTTPSSVRLLDLLRAAHSEGQSTTGPRQLSNEKFPKMRQAPFDLEVLETAPTDGQVKTILSFIGTSKANGIVDGARSVDEAVTLLAQEPKRFITPLVVDWNGGKTVLDGDESELKALLKSIPHD